MSRINLYTIPAGASFAEELARGVIARFSTAADPAAISRALILVPTRRAIRTLGEAFARTNPAGVAVLPKIRALGDFDDEPISLSGGQGEDFGDEFVDTCRPPMSVLRRELLLTSLIVRWSKSQPGKGLREAAGSESPVHALKLAQDLAKLLDQATAEGLNWDVLRELVPPEMAEHWNMTLGFLSILHEVWPGILAAEGASDPSEHRDRSLREAAARWKLAPPDFPVIVAGSTGSVPATAELLTTIVGMENGAVVLPGIDLELDEESWNAAGPGHPQHGMQQFLHKLGAVRSCVESWTVTAIRSERVRLIAEALRPADTTPHWRRFVSEQSKSIGRGLLGLGAVVARTPAEEALVIACAMREAIETPGKTAALVTPDRGLARRVAGELARWGIAIDDSAGTALSASEQGRFVCLVADAAAAEFRPIELLALLKHPFARLGFDSRDEVRHLVGQLEADVLRGPRPPSGLSGLRLVAKPGKAYAGILDRLEPAFGGFAQVMENGRHELATLVQLHRSACESICHDPLSEMLPLWAGEAGEVADEAFSLLIEAASGVQIQLSGMEYAAFIRVILEAVSVRPHFGRHPRLSILGPLEARLQRADLMILGGLNEGVWPPVTDPGPWLNRPMRRELGMSQPERRIGLSAHDFAQSAAAPEVLLTRSEKSGGTPTTPSRWLTRLSILVEGAGFSDKFLDHRLLELARTLDQPPNLPRSVTAPAPTPPVFARPREIPVTDVELWVRDPYALYAKRILRLRKLKALDEAPSAADRGSVIHKALEKFVQAYPTTLPDEVESRRILLESGRVAFGDMLERPGVKSFWWPRFERAAAWFLNWEVERRKRLVRVYSEQTGSITFNAPGGPFRLTAKADRIEVLTGDRVAIADYKTGTPPSNKQVEQGFSSQLTLEGAIALHEGFPGIKATSVAELFFVSLRGGDPAGEERQVGFKTLTFDQAAEKAFQRFCHFAAQFDSVDMPYLSKPHVIFDTFAGDYDHLARVKEWSSDGET